MSGLNKVMIIGRLGQDPEVNYMQSGDCVANFSVATSEKWKDKRTGETQESTEWHRVTCWRRLGEIASEYLAKGSLVYIEGKLKTRKWERDGQTHYTTGIEASQMQMLGSRPDGQQGQQQYRQAGPQQTSAPPRQRAPASPPPGQASWSGSPQQSHRAYQSPPQHQKEFDDDIPF